MEAEGRSGEIGEQQIGVAVFGRSSDYDPSIDGIVRSHASRLRLRLDQYFENEGIHETVRLSIPRGAYVPIYELRATEPESPLLGSPPLASSPPIRLVQRQSGTVAAQSTPVALRNRPPFGWAAAAVATLALAVAFFAGMHFRASPFSRTMVRLGLQSPSDELWGSIFVPGRAAYLVVGDAGVNMFENIARRQVTTEEYSTRSWLNDPLAQTPAGYSWVPIPARSYTPWFVVDFAARVARLAQTEDGQLKILSAREMTLDNLKNDQLILVGGPEYNPWEQLLGKDQNFHVVYDGVENSISIINKKPQPGELPVYKWRQTDLTSHSGYSLISWGKNLNGYGRILQLAGNTAQGDAAAAEFLLDSTKIDPFLKKAMTRDGRINDFELVLQTNFVAGGSVDAKVIAFRMHP
jgi:hypothetical protein